MTDQERKAMGMALEWMSKEGERQFASGGWAKVNEMNDVMRELRQALAQPEQEPIQAINDVIDYLYSTGADNDMANRAHIALKQLQMNLRDQTALHLLYKGDYEDLRAQPEHPLDKKADNARELGLNYEPEHYSDCAVYNEPAYPNGECDCKQEQPEQEPVKKALRLKPHECICGYSVGHPLVPKCICKPEYTAPPKREQDLDVGIDITEHGVQLVIRRGNEIIKSEFYAAPPKREWVGLTDDDMSECIKTADYDQGQYKRTPYWAHLTTAIEAKLREKNNA